MKSRKRSFLFKYSTQWRKWNLVTLFPGTLGTFASFLSSLLAFHCTNFQPLQIKMNINEKTQPEHKKLSQEYEDRQEKSSLFARKHLLRVLGSQKSGQNREQLPLDEDK
jgi:hypothetical protein